MHDLFTQLVVLAIVSSFFVYLASRLGQSVILGYILAGVLLGPAGFGMIRDPAQIKTLSEIGIILLMFTVGIEFSLEKPPGMNRTVVLAAVLQIVISLLIGFGAGHLLQLPLGQGIFLGCVLAISSTAIVLKYLTDRGELDTIHGRLAVGILIIQDLAVIPMMLSLPALSSLDGINMPLMSRTAVKAVLIIGGLFAYGRWILPRIMDAIARTRHRETLVVATLSHCFGTSWIANEFGISLALGAFLAGWVLTFTQYAHQAVANMIPFRDGLVGLFFISIGLLLDPAFLAHEWPAVGGLTFAMILAKTALITLIVVRLGLPVRIGLLVGLMLAQIGEFSFLLTQVGFDLGLIGSHGYQLIIASTIFTMLLTPAFIKLAPGLSHGVERAFGLSRILPVPPALDAQPSKLPSKDHVILCGFGPVGVNLSLVLEREKIPYCAMDLNPTTVRQARSKDIPIFYADAYRPEALKHAGIDKARAIVITFPDPIGITRLIRSIRELNAEILLISRTRFDREVPKLYELGVDFVVIEELEASLELSQLLLEALHVKKEQVHEDLKFLRARKEAVISKAILEAKGPEEDK